MIVYPARGILITLLLCAAPAAQTQRPTRAFQLKPESPAFSKLIPEGAALEKVAGGFGFTEGPVWDPQGFLYVSDEVQNKLARVFPDGRVETMLEIVDPDGSTLDADGHFVTTASALRALIRVAPDGKYTILADKFEGKKFNSPNDVILGPDGALYFTDPTLDLPKGDTQEIPFQGVYRMGRDGAIRLLTKDLSQPNGLAFSPDGKRLYIDDSKQRDIRVYDVAKDGSLQNGRLFGKEEGRGGVPDGMRVDVNGNLFVTGPQGIWVWDPEGHHLGTIVMPEQPANLNWGDSDWSTLYITAETSVYRLKTGTRGFVPYAKTVGARNAASSAACRVQTGSYQGWSDVEISNAWVKLVLVPQLGGRLMQVTFNGHDFLYVNDQLKGQVFTPEQSATERRWFNYGGDKIWPMPEGNDDERHWAGAVGQALDTGVFASEVVSQGERCTVRLTGPPDSQIGQQYIRNISIGADSPEISFHAVMKNITGYPQEWSEQSVSQYNAADPGNPAQSNPDFGAFTPAAPQSVYLNGYHVRTGPGSNPSYSVRDGLFTLRWMNVGGEVWVDSPGDWLAVVDGSAKYTMVERFRYERNAEYPGKASVIFYTTGAPTANRRPPPADQPRRQQLFYMEAELNSPMVRLEPGETYAMDTKWSPTRMGSEFKAVTYAGVVGQPFAATQSPSGVLLTGAFGVFFPGRIEARCYDGEGLRLGVVPVQDVSPFEGVKLQQTIAAPDKTARVSLHLVDRQGVDRGPLGEAKIEK